MEGTPASAMRWHDLLELELFQMRHGVGNQPFHRRPCQMQSPKHAIQRDIRKHLTGIEEDIDDTRMRTGTEDDDALLPHMHRYDSVHP